MKKSIFFFLVLLSPGVLILVNESNSPISTEFSEEKCTRFCHSKRCIHFEKKLKSGDTFFYKKVDFLVEKNIELLKNNPFGLDYKTCNLLFYVVLSPMIILILLGNLFRKI